MASSARTPRSISDATRFTATTPHAVSKPSPSGSGSTPSPSSSPTVSASSSTARSGGKSRFVPPTGIGSRSNGSPSVAQRQPGPGPVSETPEQRVARLRAAHLAARNTQVPVFDRIVNRTRGVFDGVYKVATVGLISFSVLAGLASVYAGFDMWVFNRKRRAEFIEAQKKIEADSLEAARLAYMRNEATPEQIELVEEVNARGDTSLGSIFSKMPGVIGAPATIKVESEPTAADAGLAKEWTRSQAEESEAPPASRAGWVKSLFFGGLKTDDDVSGGAGAVSVTATVADKARAAFEKEKENQQKGGPLDQIGNAQPAHPQQSAQQSASGSGSDPAPPRKGWW